MEREQQRRIVEAVILASPEPVPPARIAAVLPRCNPSQVRALVKELNEEYAEQRRAFEIWEVAGGYQIRSLPEFAPYVKQLQDARPTRLSNAALETLAIVAYRQPVTRAEVEHIRGVDAGAGLRSLLQRHLIRIAGHREVPGRPIVYATTRRFLEVFGLAKLGDLPTLRELAELVPGGEADFEPGAFDEVEGEAPAPALARDAADAEPQESAQPDSRGDEAGCESAAAPALAPPRSATH